MGARSALALATAGTPVGQVAPEGLQRSGVAPGAGVAGPGTSGATPIPCCW